MRAGLALLVQRYERKEDVADSTPRARLSDTVARELRRLISDGTYPVGSKLPNEKDLANQLGVGRSSMREAVRTLQAAGYLRSAHGSGVFVENDRPANVGPLDLTLSGGFTVSDLCEVRIAIEMHTAELAAHRLTDHHRELLDSIVTAAAAPEMSDADFVLLDGRFHRQIAEASGNPLLLAMWESVAAQFVEYSHKVIGMPGRRERAHLDHRAIADAIIAGDKAAASELAVEHVKTVQRELGQQRPELHTAANPSPTS